jgi:acyl-CoA thioesterase
MRDGLGSAAVSTYEFDTDTAVTRLGEGAYTATVTERWSIGNAPNGGYTMAIAQRALVEALGRPDALSVTAHFLRPPAPGPVDIDVEQVRSGRSISTGMVRVEQDGQELLRMLGSCTDLSRDDGAQRCETGPPDLPPIEQCLRGNGVMPGGGRATVVDRFDLRVHPAHVGWSRGAPTGRMEVAAWIRLADGREPDVAMLPTVVDALPPTVFELGVAGWVPTLELTLHARARPAPGWLRCHVRSRFVTGGYVEEDAEVWDDEDRLVAQSRQLARMPRARG